MKLVIFSICSFIFQNINSNKHFISLKITGFESDKGKAMVMLLDKNGAELQKQILTIKGKKVVFQFDPIESGFYAVKTFHDSNSNGKLDTNLLGVPKEKWGVSNNIKANLGPPDFKKMLFEVKNDTQIHINLH